LIQRFILSINNLGYGSGAQTAAHMWPAKPYEVAHEAIFIGKKT